MRTTLTLLAALLALLIAATPVAAHHGKGSHGRGPDSDGGPKGAKSEKHGGFAACDWRSDPGSCPGNSGWAHWCKDQHGPGQARGQCVAEHARAQGNDNDDDLDDIGDLRITEIDVDDGGSFRIQGWGAEGSVTIWVGGISGQVVGFGQGQANHEGRFDIVGQWACRDDDDPHDARVRAQDDDERASERATFTCDEEE